MIKIGVIGFGYWGPNIVRNFEAVDGASVASICDSNPLALKKAKKSYPYIHSTINYKDIIKCVQIDAVAIMTSVKTHYLLAKEALMAGKHVFVAKPLTFTSQESKKLIDLAKKKKLKIMVDHTFLFTGAVEKVKELVDKKVLGDIFYYDSTRVNLGLFQHDVNVIWDLAPHDFSIMDYVIKNKPVAISAHGAAHFDKKKEDIAYITVYFKNNFIAHINLNWLSPVKVRKTLIGGEKKMIVWNDLDMDEKIKVYDKGITLKNREKIYKLLVDYRSGDMWAPRISHQEALKKEAQYFVDCIEKNTKPFNDGESGLRVVQMLEACHKSLRNEGRLVKL